MSPPGDAELLIVARSVLLDALDALAEQRRALVLIGAQAIYLHTGAAPARARCWSQSCTSSASARIVPTD